MRTLLVFVLSLLIIETSAARPGEDPVREQTQPSAGTAAVRTPAANTVAYFAIEADDLVRARRFYEEVFGWRFTNWGGSDYWLIQTGHIAQPGIMGGLQRRTQPRSGTGSRSFECTIAVASIEDTARQIARHGGQIIEAPHDIPGVGTLLYFLDTEGNRVGAMQYSHNL